MFLILTFLSTVGKKNRFYKTWKDKFLFKGWSLVLRGASHSKLGDITRMWKGRRFDPAIFPAILTFRVLQDTAFDSWYNPGSRSNTLCIVSLQMRYDGSHIPTIPVLRVRKISNRGDQSENFTPRCVLRLHGYSNSGASFQNVRAAIDTARQWARPGISEVRARGTSLVYRSSLISSSSFHQSLVLSLIPQEFLRTLLHSGLVFTPDHSPGFCERARDPLFSLSLLIVSLYAGTSSPCPLPRYAYLSYDDQHPSTWVRSSQCLKLR